MGFFIQPSRGLSRTIRRFLDSSEHVLYSPRLWASDLAASRLSQGEKHQIETAFNLRSQPSAVSARKEWFAKRLSSWSQGDKGAFRVVLDEVPNA